VALCPPCHAQTDAAYARRRLPITPLLHRLPQQAEPAVLGRKEAYIAKPAGITS
jgi:hypothetical protein